MIVKMLLKLVIESIKGGNEAGFKEKEILPSIRQSAPTLDLPTTPAVTSCSDTDKIDNYVL